MEAVAAWRGKKSSIVFIKMLAGVLGPVDLTLQMCRRLMWYLVNKEVRFVGQCLSHRHLSGNVWVCRYLHPSYLRPLKAGKYTLAVKVSWFFFFLSDARNPETNPKNVRVDLFVSGKMDKWNTHSLIMFILVLVCQPCAPDCVVTLKAQWSTCVLQMLT